MLQFSTHEKHVMHMKILPTAHFRSFLVFKRPQTERQSWKPFVNLEL